MGGAFQVAEERVTLVIHADEADDRVIGSGPVFGGAAIGLVAQRPDAEIGIMGDHRIGWHLGNLELGREAEGD